MRIFYSLIFMIAFAFSLHAQTGMSIANNNSSFYITDTNCEDANPYDAIIWPCDFETISCKTLSDPSICGKPVITTDAINQIQINFEDLSGLSGGNEILRKWTVIDTRQYKQGDRKGIWEYIQKLKVIKSNPPVFISETHDQEFCIYKYDCSSDFINLTANAIDDCTQSTAIEYAFKIDLNNNGTVDYKSNTNDASDIFPYGKHKITWFAKDGCGNIAQCEYFFEVKDCIPPISNCINGLMVELLPDNGEVTIQTTDFDQGSYDNCALEEFRIVSPSKGDGQTLPPPAGSKSVTFDCSSKGVNSVDFWVKDKSGNWDYCTTYVIVEDNNLNCDQDIEPYESLSQEVSKFVEEYPLEKDKMYIPKNGIQQSENTGFIVYPSQPNPFEEEATISFDLEENTKMTFTIQDVSGKVVKIIEKEFIAGNNKVIVRREDFNEAGIYFFTFKSITHKATGKIILIQR